MAEYNIKEIIEKLLGSITPIGETNYDEKCFKNIKEWGELYYWLTEKLVDVVENNRKDLYSVKQCAEEAERQCSYAFDILLNVLKQ